MFAIIFRPIYADDIILIVPTATVLRHLLIVCESELVKLDIDLSK